MTTEDIEPQSKGASAPAAPDEPEEAAGDGNAPGGEPVGDGDHVVGQGQCISSIAKDTGHFWKTIWNHGRNAQLRQVRKDPNVLLPGDKVFVPPIRQKEEPGATGKRHRFRRLGEPAKLVMRLLKQGKPRAGVAYRVEIDGQTFQGAADGAGKFTVPIPGNARHGKLYVGNPADEEEYDLHLGGLDPIEACTGLQARLKNLGFGCDITGELDEDTRAAIRSFQIENNLKVTGEPDQQLRDMVKQKHGS